MLASLDPRLLIGFLLALTRVSGIVALVPFPGLRNGPEPARILFALTMTWCLRPAWPPPPDIMPGLATLSLWILAEATFGVTVGLFVSFLLEAFQVGAQMLSVQAGYSYASTVDPNTQADSGVVVVIIQLMSGLCFFAAGLDREILAAVGRSFQTIPPGSFVINARSIAAVTQTGSLMISTGLRIAMPVIAFLLLVDLALALLGRVQSQLQLLSLAFPAKMLASLLLLSSLAALFPAVFESTAHRTIAALGAVLGG